MSNQIIITLVFGISNGESIERNVLFKKGSASERTRTLATRFTLLTFVAGNFERCKKCPNSTFSLAFFESYSHDSDPLSSLYHNMPTFTHTAPFDTHKPALLSSHSCLADSCRFLLLFSTFLLVYSESYLLIYFLLSPISLFSQYSPFSRFASLRS